MENKDSAVQNYDGQIMVIDDAEQFTNATDQNLIKALGTVLLEIGTILMSSGANTGRIRNNLNRIADAHGFKTELLISHRSLMLTISDDRNCYHFNSLKRTPPHGVNFKVVTGISRLSWRVVDEKLSVGQIKKELDRLLSLPHYPRWIILTLVGLAGASFCRLAGGTLQDMLIVFAATSVGLFVRQESHKLQFNPFLCIYFASLTASLIAGLFVKFGFGNTHEPAFVTCVLFLIPGVPLINSFSDLIEGNLQNALIRGLSGLIISFCIALGLLTSTVIYQF